MKNCHWFDVPVRSDFLCSFASTIFRASVTKTSSICPAINIIIYKQKYEYKCKDAVVFFIAQEASCAKWWQYINQQATVFTWNNGLQ